MSKKKPRPVAVKLPLTTADRLRLAAEASVDPRTVETAYEGVRPMRPNVYQRVVEAAARLSFPSPPARVEA